MNGVKIDKSATERTSKVSKSTEMMHICGIIRIVPLWDHYQNMLGTQVNKVTGDEG